MKESITKFDLEAAFRALDEIETPSVGRVKANKPALTEIFSRKSKFDALMEEYYDISDMSELDDAKEAREAEVAQAKLARIEKIVDLDAESPEDLLPSYVGKFIMQCPQCMTLFYKDPEDVEASEEDPNTVNVNEVCQHCGNEAGYTLIGKVGEATEEETAEVNAEETVDVSSTEEGEEEFADESAEESSEDDLDLELDELDLDIEDDIEEEGKTEENFNTGSGEQVLVEELTEDASLDVTADEFEKLISSPEFKQPISDSEARAMMDELEGEKEEVKEAYFDTAGSLSDDIMHYGQFLHARWVDNAPEIKRLDKNTYRVTRSDGKSSVTVKIDDTEESDGVIRFTVNSKPFSTKYISVAQDFVRKELDAAYLKQFDVAIDESVNINNETLRYAVLNPDGSYAGVPCTSEEEARELAAQKEGRVIVELGALKEGIFDKLKDKVADTVDKVAGKLKSREAKADWLLANTMKDYSAVEVDANGQIVPNESNQKFKTFVVIGYSSRDNKGNLLKSAPAFNDTNLVIGKDGVQYKNSFKEAEKVAKAWSEKTGNGPASIYLAADKDDGSAAFICEYFIGRLENDQLDKYFNAVKDDIKNANSDANSASTDSDEQAESEDTTNESLASVMNDIEDLQEATLERFISDSLIEAYGNVAGFRLTECAYEQDKFTVDGTIFFTSGNKRKTSYVFSEALAAEGKISIHGLNEKLGLDKQFTITGHADNKTFIAESFKAAKK